LVETEKGETMRSEPKDVNPNLRARVPYAFSGMPIKTMRQHECIELPDMEMADYLREISTPLWLKVVLLLALVCVVARVVSS
jgi:hypothetical protein